MPVIQFILKMTMQEMIAAFAFSLALISFFVTWWRYRLDQQQQRAAQTRQDLQAIIGDCNRFLRPLSQDPPYPILYTATNISKEFCSRMGESPHREDVLALLTSEDLLRSICVEGWISSTQILHMMDIVEEVERKASSHNLQGKLLLICDASFLLADIVASICSPESFYKMLSALVPYEIISELTLQGNRKEEVEDVLNTITVDLQQSICKKFDKEFKETIRQCLYLIQIAASAYMNLKDRSLVRLSKVRDIHSSGKANSSRNLDATINKIRHNSSMSMRVVKVKEQLEKLRRDINWDEYTDLCNLITAIKADCERLSKNEEEKFSSAKVGVSLSAL